MTTTQSFGQGRPADFPVESMLAELELIADRLRHGIPDPAKPSHRWSLTAFSLFAAARIRSKDKLPPVESGRGGSGVGDPTYGDAKALVEDKDADLRAWQDLRVDVELMLTYGRHAVGILDEATPAQQRPDKPEPGCRVCSRPGKPETVHASDRCRWCWDFWRFWGLDATETILKLRRAGKTITQNVVREHMGEELDELAKVRAG